ncbi:MAG: Ig-like domain-containing protein [Clostridia bacterium]|nr:Ig-like domain-containing protein [Clostridia bacterium]
MIYVENITISPEIIVINVGDQYRNAIATASPSNASCKNISWISCDESVATVNSSGVVTGEGVGSTTLIASAQDGSGVVACCAVTVKQPLTDISLKCTDKYIERGSHRIIHITFTPNNATNKTLSLTASGDGIVTVRQESGEIIVTGVSAGKTTITATATDGSGVCATIDLEVTSIKVKSVDVYPNRMIMKHEQTAYISAMVFPCNADDRRIEWESSNLEIATVNSFGKITSHKRNGTTTITAKSASGTITDICIVTVDNRDQVKVTADPHSFNIEFPDGKIWEHIGCNLDVNSDYVDRPGYYESLNDHEKRYLNNLKNQYSTEEIAYIYLLDPLGIEYYMRHDIQKAQNLTDHGLLLYKDEVYLAIFGDSEKLLKRFNFMIDSDSGNPIYKEYANLDREDYYTNAEVLFGFHTIIDWDWSAFLKTFLEYIFGEIMDKTFDDALLEEDMEKYQALFHTGGILGSCSNDVTSYIDEYVSGEIDSKIKEAIGELLPYKWVKILLITLPEAISSAAYIPNPSNVIIYNKVNSEPNYLTVFYGFGDNITIPELIQIYNNNQ